MADIPEKTPPARVESERPGLTYADAGVSIDAGDALVERIKPAAAATRRNGVLGALGGFAGLFDLNALSLEEPILVAATDGVGTKLKLAVDAGAPHHLDGLGQDLVAMCVNDLLCQGAEPLFFLDYFATGVLDADRAARVVESVARGCIEAGAALLGGETAEMPGLYRPGEFDLAGFAVGVVSRPALLPRPIAPGDAIIGVASDGVHSNGFSLVRAILARAAAASGETAEAMLSRPAPFQPETTFADALLTPTRIYAKPLKALLSDPGIGPALRGLAHITGGGLIENPPRVAAPLGDDARRDISLEIDLDALRTKLAPPPAFQWVAETGAVAELEMLRTFNCGVGLTLFVDAARADATVDALTLLGERSALIGRVAERPGADARVHFSGRLFS